MKHRLRVGVINRYQPEPGWLDTHLDISSRGIYCAERGFFVQPEIVADVGEWLPMLPDEAFDEVVAHHVLEHLTPEKAQHALRALHRVLKPEGVLDIEVPDLDRVCRAWVDESLGTPGLLQWLYGETRPEHETGDTHHHGYTSISLRVLLAEEGFFPGEEIPAGHAARFRAVKT